MWLFSVMCWRHAHYRVWSSLITGKLGETTGNSWLPVCSHNDLVKVAGLIVKRKQKTIWMFYLEFNKRLCCVNWLLRIIMQVILRLLLAIIHVFYDFIYWSRLQWNSCIKLIFKSENSSEENNVLIESIKGVRNLPKHLVVILGHEEISFVDLIRIIGWCVIAGIPYVSFYDHNGETFDFVNFWNFTY